MRYHGLKMAEINKIIKEYWINTYKGNGETDICIGQSETISMKHFRLIATVRVQSPVNKDCIAHLLRLQASFFRGVERVKAKGGREGESFLPPSFVPFRTPYPSGKACSQAGTY